MSQSFVYQNQHHCSAVVVACIDFRFWASIVDYIKNDLNIKDFDLIALPGAAKAINEEGDNAALRAASISFNLHQSEKLIIVNHWDCGAYGGSGQFASAEAEKAFHGTALRQARDRVLAAHPDKEVIMLLARLFDNNQKIDIINVT